jgi:hypothetical protein
MEFLHPNWYTLLFVLVFFHCLADYPLQGDFLAQAKNRTTDLGKIFWKHALLAHAMIHAGFVFLATGVLWMALAEFVIHAIVDDLKCRNRISLDIDQLLHLTTKVVIVLAWWL